MYKNRGFISLVCLMCAVVLAALLLGTTSSAANANKTDIPNVWVYQWINTPGDLTGDEETVFAVHGDPITATLHFVNVSENDLGFSVAITTPVEMTLLGWQSYISTTVVTETATALYFEGVIPCQDFTLEKCGHNPVDTTIEVYYQAHTDARLKSTLRLGTLERDLTSYIQVRDNLGCSQIDMGDWTRNPYWVGSSGLNGIKISNNTNLTITNVLITSTISDEWSRIETNAVYILDENNNTVCAELPCTVGQIGKGNYVQAFRNFTPKFTGIYTNTWVVSHNGYTAIVENPISVFGIVETYGPDFMGISQTPYRFGFEMGATPGDLPVNWTLWTGGSDDDATTVDTLGGSLQDWEVRAIGPGTIDLHAQIKIGWALHPRVVTKHVEMVPNDFNAMLQYPEQVLVGQQFPIQLLGTNKSCRNIEWRHSYNELDGKPVWLDGNIVTLPQEGNWNVTAVLTCFKEIGHKLYAYNFVETFEVLALSKLNPCLIDSAPACFWSPDQNHKFVMLPGKQMTIEIWVLDQYYPRMEIGGNTISLTNIGGGGGYRNYRAYWTPPTSGNYQIDLELWWQTGGFGTQLSRDFTVTEPNKLFLPITRK